MFSGFILWNILADTFFSLSLVIFFRQFPKVKSLVRRTWAFETLATCCQTSFQNRSTHIQMMCHTHNLSAHLHLAVPCTLSFFFLKGCPNCRLLCLLDIALRMCTIYLLQKCLEMVSLGCSSQRYHVRNDQVMSEALLPETMALYSSQGQITRKQNELVYNCQWPLSAFFLKD